jgi:hypothetical protein
MLEVNAYKLKINLFLLFWPLEFPSLFYPKKIIRESDLYNLLSLHPFHLQRLQTSIIIQYLISINVNMTSRSMRVYPPHPPIGMFPRVGA